MSETTKAPFNPRDHLRTIKGKGGNAEYLDVKFRLVWLRSEHPDAGITSEHIEISPDIAIFKATVSIPGGGHATGYGSETPRDFGDYIEKAETKAIGRALAALGYGTQFAPELDEGDRIVDSPREPRPTPPVRPQDARNAPAPTTGPAKHVAATTPATRPAANEHPEWGWNEAWAWLKHNGINDQQGIVRALGGTYPGWTPGEICTAIEQKQEA